MAKLGTRAPSLAMTMWRTRHRQLGVLGQYLLNRLTFEATTQNLRDRNRQAANTWLTISNLRVSRNNLLVI